LLRCESQREGTAGSSGSEKFVAAYPDRRPIGSSCPHAVMRRTPSAVLQLAKNAGL
jgi:hypothetical protein